MNKMKVEIWSDVMCPFCYIGKRKFEQSLKTSDFNDAIEIEWKSYQLNPDLVTDPSIRLEDYLSKIKGMSVEQAKQANKQITEMAKSEGLEFNLDTSIIANSMKAHQLIHFAKKHNKQNEAEEVLFRSYFTDSKNIDDDAVLQDLITELNLDPKEFEKALKDEELVDEVKMDIHEARQLGVQGVPFFVYDRKYAISGAQPLELFEQTLEKAYKDWKPNHLITLDINTDGPSCGPEGC